MGLGVTDDSSPLSGEVGLPPPSPLPTAAEAEAIETGHELSEEDLKALRVFMRELVVQSVVPWIERQVVVGNEQVRLSVPSLLLSRLHFSGRMY